jgi:DNA-binding transcriptional LysR family regulator
MWNEIQSAAEVARLGTISGAAEALGVHRATVHRHIETLESDLGAKLFQRHARGYVATELGSELLRIANATSEQMDQLRVQAEGSSSQISGDIVITAIDVVAPSIMPVIQKFKERYPAMRTVFQSSQSLAKLEYGEAHVAFRVGPKPSDPDNVVRHYQTIQMGLYASKSYVARAGLPDFGSDLRGHDFVSVSGASERAPFSKWYSDLLPVERITFVANQLHAMHAAIRAGIGIGFAPVTDRDADLVPVGSPNPDWQTSVWIVTHVDLHRSAKVQAFLNALRTSRDVT